MKYFNSIQFILLSLLLLSACSRTINSLDELEELSSEQDELSSILDDLSSELLTSSSEDDNSNKIGLSSSLLNLSQLESSSSVEFNSSANSISSEDESPSSSEVDTGSSINSISSSQINLSSSESISSISTETNSSSVSFSSSSSKPLSSSSSVEFSSSLLLSSSSQDTTVVVDSRDGNKYPLTWIGEQVWMRENLRYNEGICFDCDRIGNLYSATDVKYYNLCPEGFHIPSIEDWDELADYIANQEGLSNKINWDWADIAPYLKSTKTWSGQNPGNDSYNFSAISTGYYERALRDSSSRALWWTSSEMNSNFPYAIYLGEGNSLRFIKVDIYGENYFGRFPVRCLKNNQSNHQMTSSPTSSFFDARNHKTYSKTKIGEQTWMAENLDYYINEQNRYCPHNSATYCEKYGTYYTLSQAQTYCPMGWKLPAKSDWDQLGDYVNGQISGNKIDDGYWQTVGKELKATSGWVSFPGNNNTGFNAIYGSGYTTNTNNGIAGYNDVYFWGNSGNTWVLSDQGNELRKTNYNSGYHMSVRCVEITP